MPTQSMDRRKEEGVRYQDQEDCEYEDGKKRDKKQKKLKEYFK